jgi:hypothetical protein
MTEQLIPVDDLNIDIELQPRMELNMDYVADLKAALCNGADLPPVTVYHDGSTYWLADGYHRNFAYAELMKLDPAHYGKIPCIVVKGTKRDAILHAVGANHDHGLRRGTADKIKAVRILLYEETWQKWSDNKIAEQCHVSPPFVAKQRAKIAEEMAENPDPSEQTSEGASSNIYRCADGKRLVSRGGKTYEIDTTNIGKAAKGKDATDGDQDPDSTKDGRGRVVSDPDLIEVFDNTYRLKQVMSAIS